MMGSHVRAVAAGWREGESRQKQRRFLAYLGGSGSRREIRIRKKKVTSSLTKMLVSRAMVDM